MLFTALSHCDELISRQSHHSDGLVLARSDRFPSVDGKEFRFREGTRIPPATDSDGRLPRSNLFVPF